MLEGGRAGLVVERWTGGIGNGGGNENRVRVRRVVSVWSLSEMCGSID